MPPISQGPPSSIAARLDDCVFAVRKRMPGWSPRVGVVLGSALGPFPDSLRDLVKIPFHDLPHMAPPAVAGHAGNLCFGRVGDTSVVCLQGRIHLYEGHPVDRVVQGVRVMARLGVRCVLVTNAAGALEPSWSPGDLMVVTDHINLTGVSPLVGPNDEALGPRFPDMSAAYDPQLREELQRVAVGTGTILRDGVYAAMLGPQYETPAEIRMLRAMGAQAVGMSTVHEVIALRHMGIRVGALSCITNLAAGVGARPLDHAEVEATARSQRDSIAAVLTRWIQCAGAGD